MGAFLRGEFSEEKMNAIYKAEPSKSIDAQWQANKVKANQILEAIKYALNRPFRAINSNLPCDLDNPETQAEVDAVTEFATQGYDLSCDLSGIFEEMMCGEQVQKCLDDQQETEGDQDRMREAGMNNGDF
jgi:hypothetical protein